MLFFKRILDTTKAEAPTDRRGATRYAVAATFPMNAVLNTVGRDEMGLLLKPKDGEGWDWKGRVINLSSGGARMQLPPTVHAQRGDACRLKFDLQGYVLTVPGKIAHISDRHDSFLYGIQFDLSDAATAHAYRQLLELVALGAALKPTKPTQADESGYLVEEYAGDEASSLVVWRDIVGRTVAAFDFRLRDYHVRGLADKAELQYLVGADRDKARTAPPAQGAEIRRLFVWVVPNLSADVPADVRDFLAKFAA